MFSHTRARLAIMVMALAFSLAPAMVSAQSVPPTTPPVIRDTHHDGCHDAVGSNSRHTGSEYEIPNAGNARGVSALIKVVDLTTWRECTDSFGTDGPSSWVSLEPSSWTGNSTFDTIVQIGLINCNSLALSVCAVSNTYSPRFFWAKGGCGANPDPVPVDLGQAYDNTEYRFSIRRYVDANHSGGGGQYLSLKINGTERVKVWYDDPAVSCWIDDDKEANWFTETWDEGDTLGINKGLGTNFRDMDYYVGATWIKYTNGTCFNAGAANNVHPMHCDVDPGNYGLGSSLYTWSS